MRPVNPDDARRAHIRFRSVTRRVVGTGRQIRLASSLDRGGVRPPTNLHIGPQSGSGRPRDTRSARRARRRDRRGCDTRQRERRAAARARSAARLHEFRVDGSDAARRLRRRERPSQFRRRRLAAAPSDGTRCGAASSVRLQNRNHRRPPSDDPTRYAGDRDAPLHSSGAVGASKIGLALRCSVCRRPHHRERRPRVARSHRTKFFDTSERASSGTGNE